MKKPITTLFFRLSLGAAGLMLASCSLPPAEAWRYIKRDGLIPYIAMEIKHENTPGGQPSRFIEQRPVAAPIAVAAAPVATPAPVITAKAATPAAVAPTPKPPTLVLTTRGAAPGDEVVVTRPVKPKARDAADALANAPKPTPKPAPAPAAKPILAPEVVATPAAPKPEPKKEVATVPAAPVKPAPAPEKPTVPSKATQSAPAVAGAAKLDGLPYGSPVAGRPGLVNSPYAGKMQLVDVTGLKPGQEVKCPYSGKLFRVPPGATATAKQASDEPTKK
jgi:hypothetical protein